jgi:hypothetical protein
MKRVLAVFVTVAALAVPAPAAGAAAPPPAEPIDLVGELGGAPFEIRVPAAWNGTLVMFAHGYRDLADHPGEFDDRSVSAFANDAAEQAMLAAGYAIAGSAYETNGWAVREGISDTKALVQHFRQVVGEPDRTLIAGFSMGSLVALDSIEDLRGTYDGALGGCAVGAGAPLAFDSTLAVASAYDAVFGWPAAWGTPADVRDDLDFESEVLPTVVAQFSAPGGFGRFEFLRLVAGGPLVLPHRGPRRAGAARRRQGRAECRPHLLAQPRRPRVPGHPRRPRCLHRRLDRRHDGQPRLARQPREALPRALLRLLRQHR